MDECSDAALNDCHASAICTDLMIGFECECDSSWTDVDPTNPGRNCVEFEPCCESIRIAKDYSGIVESWAICNKTSEDLNHALNEGGPYYMYQCDDAGQSTSGEAQHLRGSPMFYFGH